MAPAILAKTQLSPGTGGVYGYVFFVGERNIGTAVGRQGRTAIPELTHVAMTGVDFHVDRLGVNPDFATKAMTVFLYLAHGNPRSTTLSRHSVTASRFNMELTLDP